MTTMFDVLIAGGGQVAAQVATDLRTKGFAGSIGIVGEEPAAPYERPPLSKEFLLTQEVTAADLAFRPEGFWADSSVDLLLAERVETVDAAAHTVQISRGERLSYGRLVWAAGGRVRRLPVDGAELDGVLYLRTVADAEELRERIALGGPAVIVGGGFVGLEVAASLAARGLDVTVVETEKALLSRVTSGPVSQHVERLHRRAGVEIVLGTTVRGMVGRNGSVSGVELSDGRTLPAALVLVGIGIVPNVEPLVAAGVVKGNGVLVDADGRTNLPDVYAAGDCACSVKPFTSGEPTRLESVNNAVLQGRAVAASILGSPRPRPAVPWFWSNQYDLKYKAMGMAAGYDEAITRGVPDSGSFSVVYLRAGVVVALESLNATRDYAQAKALIEAGIEVDPRLVADPEVPLKEIATRQPAC